MDFRYAIDDPFDLLSPSLVIFRVLVRKNLGDMITMARGPDWLRPHVKTHKMAEIVRMAAELGISKHKCATIAEAEMVAASGGTDVLLAYPLVGPNLLRWARLIRAYPGTTFRAIVDHPDSARALSEAVQDLDRPVPVLVDLEVGMGRTGIDSGEPAAGVRRGGHGCAEGDMVVCHSRMDKLGRIDLGYLQQARPCRVSWPIFRRTRLQSTMSPSDPGTG